MKIYIAIPYSGIEKLSFKLANFVSSEIMKLGHIPFSPISMSHPIVQEACKYHTYDKKLMGSWQFWEKIDCAFIDWCDEVWVININDEYTKNSIGVQGEISYAKKIGKNVRYINIKYNESLFLIDNIDELELYFPNI